MALLTGVNGGAYVGTATGPDPGIFVTAASVIVAVQAVLNVLAFLNADKFSQLLGGTIEGATSFIADVEFNAVNVEIQNGSMLTIQPTAAVVIQSQDVRFDAGSDTAFNSGSIVRMLGRVRRRPRVLLPSGNQSIGVVDGDRFELIRISTGSTITLKSVTGDTAVNTEMLEFVLPNMAGGAGIPGSWTLARESGVTVATILMDGTSSVSASATFEFVGGLWRLGASSGYDSALSVGVRPGPGA